MEGNNKFFLIVEKIPRKEGNWKYIEKTNIKASILDNFGINVSLEDIHWCLSTCKTLNNDDGFRSCGIYLSNTDISIIFNKIKKGKRLILTTNDKAHEWGCFIEVNQKTKKAINRINSADNLVSYFDKEAEAEEKEEYKEDTFINNDYKELFLKLISHIDETQQNQFYKLLHNNVLNEFVHNIFIDEMKKVDPNFDYNFEDIKFNQSNYDTMYNNMFNPGQTVLSPTRDLHFTF